MASRDTVHASTKKPISSTPSVNQEAPSSTERAMPHDNNNDAVPGASTTRTSTKEYDPPLAPGANLRVPKNVLLYINAYRYALDNDKELPLASKSIYDYVIANWDHFKGNPSKPNGSKLNLGEEWLLWAGDDFAPEDVEPVSTIGPTKSKPMTIRDAFGLPPVSSKVPHYYQKPLQDPSRPIPHDVMQYIRGHRKALDASRQVGLPSQQVYTWIMDNWLRFSGDRDHEDATIFDLGENWYVETRNRMLQDHLSPNPQVEWPGTIAPYEISQGRTRYQMLEDMVTGVAMTTQSARNAGYSEDEIEAAEILAMMRAGNTVPRLTSKQHQWAAQVKELAMVHQMIYIGQLPLSYMRWTGHYLRDGRSMPADVETPFNEAFIAKYGSLEAMKEASSKVLAALKTLPPLRDFLDLATLPLDMRQWIETNYASGSILVGSAPVPVAAPLVSAAERERKRQHQLQRQLDEQNRKDAEDLLQYNEERRQAQIRRYAEIKARRQREQEAEETFQFTFEAHTEAQKERHIEWAKRVNRLLSYEYILDVPRTMPADFRDWTMKFLRDRTDPPPHIAKVLMEDITDEQYKRLGKCEVPDFYVPLESFVDLSKLPTSMVAWLAPAYRSGAIAGVPEPAEAAKTRTTARQGTRAGVTAEAEPLGRTRGATRSIIGKRKVQEEADDSGFVGGEEDREKDVGAMEGVRAAEGQDVEDDSGFIDGDSEELLLPRNLPRTSKRRKTSGDSVVNVRTDLQKSPTKKSDKASGALSQLSSFTPAFTGPSTSKPRQAPSLPPFSSLTGSFSIHADQSATARKTIAASGARKPRTQMSQTGSSGSEVQDANSDSDKENEPTIKPQLIVKLVLKRKAMEALSQSDSRSAPRSSAEDDENVSSADGSASQDDLYQGPPAKKPKLTVTFNNDPVARATTSSTEPQDGKPSRTITGPSADKIKALENAIPKNSSSRPEDKIWKLEHYGRPMTAERALKKDIDVINKPDSQAVKDMLSLRFSFKQDPLTFLTVVFRAPEDWNDQEQITKLIKSMGQIRRREAGSGNETRHAYTDEEVDWLAKYFENRPHLHGKKQNGQFWDNLAVLFNAKFENRVSKAIASKDGQSGAVGKRSAHALMSICERSDKILAARKINPRKRVMGEEEENEEEEMASPQPPKKKRGRPSKAK